MSLLPRRRPLLAALASLSLLAPACDQAPEAPSVTPRAPVLVIGLDGLEWSVIQPLLAAGRMPHTRALMERGCFGWLGTFIPTHSPVVWTTIATGKTMKQHGISGFLDPTGQAFTSTQRSGKAVWNIADDHGLTSNVFGWWITWPVEPVRGVMVSATSASSMVNDNWKPALVPGIDDQVHPPELAERVMAVADEVGAKQNVLDLARDKVFGDLSRFQLQDPEARQINQSLWSVQSDATYFEVARDLMADHPADLSMVYFGGTDVVGHRFWRQYEPDPYAWAGADPLLDLALAEVLPNYYAWADEIIGALVEQAGPDADIFVVSDHGMHAVSIDRPNQIHNTGNHQDGAPGVLIAAGPDIRRQGGVQRFIDSGALATVGQVTDITPTLLALLGIPTSRDMRGRVLSGLMTPEAKAAVGELVMVESHDTGFRSPSRFDMPAERNAEFAERMRALGYTMGPTPTDADSQPVNPEGFTPDTSYSGAEDG